MKLLIVFGTESVFSFSGSYEWYRPTSSYSTQPSIHTSATQLLYCARTHTHRFDTVAHTCKSSVSRSRAIRFVLQVPWHKPSSQEANHIKSMSHVAAYTGSEALRGVMLDIVLHPHTVTQIPQPQLFLGDFDSKPQHVEHYRAHLKLWIYIYI